jgi:NADPH:quinone reductase-like Zn-dependent oxidoreductase
MNDLSPPPSLLSKSVRVGAKAADAAGLADVVHLAETPVAAAAGMALVEVRSAGVNPSDVKAILGAMPQAVWPRTPGRDYAGVVVQGSAAFVGKEVWGAGGDLGIRRDGSHARYLSVDPTVLRLKPAALTMAEAGAIGVPFITASEGFREAGGIKAGDVVLVLASSGKVGQAAVQIATAQGARVFGVARGATTHHGHASAPVTMLDAGGDIAAALRAATGGHGADIVYNVVGSPYFAAANAAMAHGGRQIFISTTDRAVPFDIFQFYRGRHRYVGVDSLALGQADCAAVLDGLRPGFDSGALKPFPVLPEWVYPLERAVEAYRAVLGGARERVVLDPLR